MNQFYSTESYDEACIERDILIEHQQVNYRQCQLFSRQSEENRSQPAEIAHDENNEEMGNFASVEEVSNMNPEYRDEMPTAANVDNSVEIKKESSTEPEAIAALADILAFDDSAASMEEGFDLIDREFPMPVKSKLPDGFIKHENDVFSGNRIYRQVKVNTIISF